MSNLDDRTDSKNNSDNQKMAVDFYLPFLSLSIACNIEAFCGDLRGFLIIHPD